MHPNFTNRLRAEMRRIAFALSAERASERPDPRRIRDLKARYEWLKDALWAAEMEQCCSHWPGANPSASARQSEARDLEP